jgi:hypothetical protein
VLCRVFSRAPVADYPTAIEWTERTIQCRAAYVRNQITVIVLTALVILAAAMSLRSSIVLALLFLLPLCGAFLAADDRLVAAWRNALLDGWTRKDIDLAAFRVAIRAHPRLPKTTLEGMLSTLPDVGDLVTEQGISAADRRAVAVSVKACHRRSSVALVLRVAASAIAAVGLVAALLTTDVRALLFLSAPILVPVVY